MNYPDWFVNSLIEFNHHTTCMNEWELIDMAADLHRQPDLPERLEVLFESLKGGLGKEVLLTGNFLALGYYDSGGNPVFPRFIELGKKAQALLELRKQDGEAAVYAFERAIEEVNKSDADERHALIIQLPYFIKKIGYYAPGDEISFLEFQEKFNDRQVIFTEIQRVASPADVEQWFAEHRRERYEQRFLFTLGLLVHNGIEDTLLQPNVQQALGYFIGSFLSWAGMGVADSTRVVMAAAAASLAHYSHEFLKPFAELQDFLNRQSSSLPTELTDRLRPVLNQVKLLDLSRLMAAFSPKSFKELLRGALKNSTNISIDQELSDGRYLLALKIRDAKNKMVQIDFLGLPDSSVFVRFDASYFDRLMRNLLRNVGQHSASDQPAELNIKIELDMQYGFLIMHFKHIGSPPIPRQVKKLLFRMPVSTGSYSGSKGIGLWTVGMAFEAQRLPLPKVTQHTDGICFTFRFPILEH
jgi:signal transduction histidine kinase